MRQQSQDPREDAEERLLSLETRRDAPRQMRGLLWPDVAHRPQLRVVRLLVRQLIALLTECLGGGLGRVDFELHDAAPHGEHVLLVHGPQLIQFLGVLSIDRR